MVLRRDVLAAAAGGTSIALSGCLTATGLARTGHVSFKAIQVAWLHEGRRYSNEVLFATDGGDDRPRGRVAEEYRGIVRSVDDVRVGDDLGRELERTFTDVGYIVDICWAAGECRNPSVSRGDFDRLQFGDRAEVRFESPGMGVVDVYEGAEGDPNEWAELETFDLSERQAENGIPIA